MENIELLNLKVKHKVYGTGIITDVAENYITVQFDSKSAKFLYPDSFEKFLTAVDPSIQADIMNVINAFKQTVEMQRQAAIAAHTAEKHNIEGQALQNTKKRINIEDGFGPDYNVKHLARQPISR